jgi:molybdopterin-containing oxidoreductase family iron-sulfur binding subunit
LRCFATALAGAARVVAEKAEPTSYAMLAELGTRPRTTYLAQVKNPNPELEGKA